MMYKLRYGRNFNIGNYESERLELEREFPDEVSVYQAALKLKAEVEQTYAKIKKR